MGPELRELPMSLPRFWGFGLSLFGARLWALEEEGFEGFEVRG